MHSIVGSWEWRFEQWMCSQRDANQLSLLMIIIEILEETNNKTLC